MAAIRLFAIQAPLISPPRIRRQRHHQPRLLSLHPCNLQQHQSLQRLSVHPPAKRLTCQHARHLIQTAMVMAMAGKIIEVVALRAAPRQVLQQPLHHKALPPCAPQQQATSMVTDTVGNKTRAALCQTQHQSPPRRIRSLYALRHQAIVMGMAGDGKTHNLASYSNSRARRVLTTPTVPCGYLTDNPGTLTR